MAARLEPARVQAAHQSLHHFVAKADWGDEALLALGRGRALPHQGRVGARPARAHPALPRVAATADWCDEALLARVRAQVLPHMERHGPIQAWVVDDTGFPKKGRHSVGVTRQYCGQIGKQDNCQVAVTLSVASLQASLPIAYRLYLPERWAEDRERCAKAGVPEGVAFRTKPEIALDQIRSALAGGGPPGVG